MKLKIMVFRYHQIKVVFIFNWAKVYIIQSPIDAVHPCSHGSGDPTLFMMRCCEISKVSAQMGQWRHCAKRVLGENIFWGNYELGQKSIGRKWPGRISLQAQSAGAQLSMGAFGRAQLAGRNRFGRFSTVTGNWITIMSCPWLNTEQQTC